MKPEKTHQNRVVLLLQSGGRDSAAAAVHLLDAGCQVIALTLSANAEAQFEAPRTRALELSKVYDNYSWGMVDYTQWDISIKSWVTAQLSETLPKSCLLCALSKITAVIPYCLSFQITDISLGYTAYQSTWAEQTSHAIMLQQEHLASLGLNLVLPSLAHSSKAEVNEILIARDLSPASFENPCCIAEWGTQDVSVELITEVISLAFEFLEMKTPCIDIVNTVGDLSV